MPAFFLCPHILDRAQGRGWPSAQGRGRKEDATRQTWLAGWLASFRPILVVQPPLQSTPLTTDYSTALGHDHAAAAAAAWPRRPTMQGPQNSVPRAHTALWVWPCPHWAGPRRRSDAACLPKSSVVLLLLARSLHYGLPFRALSRTAPKTLRCSGARPVSYTHL